MNLTMKIEMCCSCTGRNSNQNVEFQTCRNWRPSQQNTTSNQQPATSNQQPATSKTPVSDAKRQLQKHNASFISETGVLKTPERRTRPRAKRLNATLWSWRWVLRPRAQRWPQDPALWHLAFWSLFLPQQLQHI